MDQRKQIEESEPWGQCHPRGTAAIAFYALKHRLVRGPLKRPVYRYIQSRCKAHDIEFDGVRLRCHISDNGPERFVIFQERRSSWDALRMITDCLKPGDVFVDVGANFGLFSTVAAKKVGRTGRVIAIEPHPEMARRLRFNVDVNGFDQVIICETAVGDQPGQGVLYVNKGSFAESSLQASANLVGNIRSRVSVPITPLFDIVTAANLSRVNSLKIDIEGYEDKALVPFFEAAPKSLWPRRILVEIIHLKDWSIDCVARMIGLGYEKRNETKSDALLVLPD